MCGVCLVLVFLPGDLMCAKLSSVPILWSCLTSSMCERRPLNFPGILVRPSTKRGQLAGGAGDPSMLYLGFPRLRFLMFIVLS